MHGILTFFTPLIVPSIWKLEKSLVDFFEKRKPKPMPGLRQIRLAICLGFEFWFKFGIGSRLTNSSWCTHSDGSGSKIFDPGWVRSAIYGLGFPSGQKNLFGFGRKVPGLKACQPLIYCGSKVSSCWVRSGPIFNMHHVWCQISFAKDQGQTQTQAQA